MSFDVQGEKNLREAEFTSSYQAPNKFRQDVKDDALAGSTGEKLYLYSKDKNVYLTHDAPKGKFAPGELPEDYNKIVGTQNPSLLMALSSDASKSLTDNLSQVEVLSSVKIDAKSFTALKLSDPQTRTFMTLLVDPATHLVRRATLDMVESLKQKGSADVKSAEVQVDYVSVKPDVEVPADVFAWVPPKDAKDAVKAAAESDPEAAVKALKGQVAKDWTAKTLKDETVSFKDLKGKVVVLDFWATWCGPCVEGLPHVDKMYQDFKAKGVQVFAVNAQETKERVQKFITEQKLTLPIVLDADGKICQTYNIAIFPATLVIGKDGKISETFVGIGPDSDEKLRAAVTAALEAK